MQKTKSRLLVGLLIGLAGCTGSGSQTVPVKGTVTFDGGPCPAPGIVFFQPLGAGGTTSRPGRAKFNEDGVFAASTFDESDGLLPGDYLVRVQCDKGQPDFQSSDPFGAMTFIDPQYEPTEVHVRKGAAILDLVLDVPMRK